MPLRRIVIINPGVACTGCKAPISVLDQAYEEVRHGPVPNKIYCIACGRPLIENEANRKRRIGGKLYV